MTLAVLCLLLLCNFAHFARSGCILTGAGQTASFDLPMGKLASVVALDAWFKLTETPSMTQSTLLFSVDQMRIVVNNASLGVAFGATLLSSSAAQIIGRYEWTHMAVVINGSSFQLLLNGNLARGATG